jgi:hypothetical protein
MTTSALTGLVFVLSRDNCRDRVILAAMLHTGGTQVSKPFAKAITLCAIGMGAAVALVNAAASRVANPEPAVVMMIDRERGRFVYRVDGKTVTPPDAPHLLRALGDALGRKLSIPGRQAAPLEGAIVLVHADVSLAIIDGADGLMTKVGFASPRVFSFGRTKTHMGELKFIRGVRFSATECPRAER